MTLIFCDLWAFSLSPNENLHILILHIYIKNPIVWMPWKLRLCTLIWSSLLPRKSVTLFMIFFLWLHKHLKLVPVPAFSADNSPLDFSEKLNLELNLGSPGSLLLTLVFPCVFNHSPFITSLSEDELALPLSDDHSPSPHYSTPSHLLLDFGIAMKLSFLCSFFLPLSTNI